MTSSIRKQYCQLDLFKFLFSIIVVSIHTKVLLDISEVANYYYLNVVCNLAVPFFFVTSGYLFFEKINSLRQTEQKAHLRTYIRHLLRMYLVWCVIWLPWKILNQINVGHFSLIDMVQYLQRVIFVSGGDALWFLPALAVAVICCYLLRISGGDGKPYCLLRHYIPVDISCQHGMESFNTALLCSYTTQFS